MKRNGNIRRKTSANKRLLKNYFFWFLRAKDRKGELKTALILIDLQNDFMPDGALPVPNGNEVIPIANFIQTNFDLIIATKDWHPLNHGSFATNHKNQKPGDIIELAGLKQILWPIHCVQNTIGAEFVTSLDTTHITKIFHKGTDPAIDSYSAFFDNAHRRDTGLGQYLQEKGVKEIYLMGVATDYCVKYSVLDACELGFNVNVIEDGCRGINLHPDDSKQAFAEMRAAGAKIDTSKNFFHENKIFHL